MTGYDRHQDEIIVTLRRLETALKLGSLEPTSPSRAETTAAVVPEIGLQEDTAGWSPCSLDLPAQPGPAGRRGQCETRSQSWMEEMQLGGLIVRACQEMGLPGLPHPGFDRLPAHRPGPGTAPGATPAGRAAHCPRRTSAATWASTATKTCSGSTRKPWRSSPGG